MAYSPRVPSKSQPSRNIHPRRPQAPRDGEVLAIRELGGLLKAHRVVLGSLILASIFLFLTVPEFHSGSIRSCEPPVLTVPGPFLSHKLLHPGHGSPCLDEVYPFPSQDEMIRLCIFGSPKNHVGNQGIRLAPTSSASKEDLILCPLKESHLPGLGLPGEGRGEGGRGRNE